MVISTTEVSVSRHDLLDDQIVDPLLLQCIRDCLGNQNAQHDGNDVVQRSSKLDDDDGERYCGSGHTS